jgi:hypothetical protein
MSFSIMLGVLADPPSEQVRHQGFDLRNAPKHDSCALALKTLWVHGCLTDGQAAAVGKKIIKAIEQDARTPEVHG